MAQSETGVKHRLSRRIYSKHTKVTYYIYIAINMYTHPPSNFSVLDFLLFYSYPVPLLQTVLNNTTKSSLFSEDVTRRHGSVTSKKFYFVISSKQAKQG